MVSCKDPKKILDKVEPWFQTEYTVSGKLKSAFFPVSLLLGKPGKVC